MAHNLAISQDDIEYLALVLAKQFGHAATRFPSERAEIAAVMPDVLPTETWRDIVNAMERLSRKL